MRPTATVLITLLLASAGGARAGALRVTSEAASTGGLGLEVAICVDQLELPSESAALEGLVVACDTVTASGPVGAAGASLRAGHAIALADGFLVPQDASFSAALDERLTPGFDAVGQELPAPASSYKARLHLDADRLTLGAGDRIDHLVAVSGGGQVEFRLTLVPAGLGGVHLALAARTDNGSYAETPPGQEIPLAGGWNLVQLGWRAGGGDGKLTVAVNGGPFTGLTDLVNAGSTVEIVRWGAVAGAVSASWGALALDDYTAFEEIFP